MDLVLFVVIFIVVLAVTQSLFMLMRSRFNPEVDRMFGYRTRSILCVPMFDRDGNVFAVSQLLNRVDGQPFSAEDELRLSGLLASIAPILEGLRQQHVGPGRKS